jgi:hypothetical protein
MRKQNSLDDFIMSNKDAFDSQMPSAHAWENIADKINNSKTSRINLWISYTKRYAAIAIILISAAIGLHIVFLSPSHNNEHSASNMNNEINEVSFFYESQIEKKKELVLTLTSHTPSIKKEIDMDFEELDAVLKELKDDLNDDVANAEVVTAMIQNYRLKLQILEQILEFVQPTPIDNINNEENDIYSL